MDRRTQPNRDGMRRSSSTFPREISKTLGNSKNKRTTLKVKGPSHPKQLPRAQRESVTALPSTPGELKNPGTSAKVAGCRIKRSVIRIPFCGRQIRFYSLVTDRLFVCPIKDLNHKAHYHLLTGVN